jgi:hypothetical protein
MRFSADSQTEEVPLPIRSNFIQNQWPDNSLDSASNLEFCEIRTQIMSQANFTFKKLDSPLIRICFGIIHIYIQKVRGSENFVSTDRTGSQRFQRG